jgi:hypothetical protein
VEIRDDALGAQALHADLWPVLAASVQPSLRHPRAPGANGVPPDLPVIMDQAANVSTPGGTSVTAVNRARAPRAAARRMTATVNGRHRLAAAPTARAAPPFVVNDLMHRVAALERAAAEQAARVAARESPAHQQAARVIAGESAADDDDALGDEVEGTGDDVDVLMWAGALGI